MGGRKNHDHASTIQRRVCLNGDHVGNFIAAPLILLADGTFLYVFVATIACYVVAIGVEMIVFSNSPVRSGMRE